ncbi:pyruvate synthase subunit PorA [Methanococcus maripaludis]|uniref:Pyruvate synthase subunit PorA n=1 Tax=Methanococcus maripaludis TaxID=39152 RepID=A0A7J9NQZ9_METMI|nr:pyruvate synthase subunit PorA [Methanococcus maripaludis]MBA2850090.1 pyruvate ferredoxin oxidoreductase alpha subunit [Methanococcus maripaludis]MBM7409546.1 pyruvate ferredoxin oxidoreductase alpha subunit [Methanococcus maripaludis]MBP2219702.1 pyruvate ferredoxin oxidoreductase alpha subunit [Methanococcus maripaludis]
MCEVKVITGTSAAAEAAKLADVDVIAAYPITPQTTCVEKLADFVANGELNAEYIKVESEHSAMSASIGASAAGARAFTATSSQGLALMHEVLFSAAGMRVPVVMMNANRALSAPINIWNDQQDSLSQRDTGWIQLYAEDNQEVLDLVIQAFKIAEDEKVLLPVMVNLDGFILTHTVEPVTVPKQENVLDFIGTYEPKHAYLDPKKPMTQGALGDPNYYMETRYAIETAMRNAEKVIADVHDAFAEKFNRAYGNGLIESYNLEKAENVIIAMGSICGTIKDMIDLKKKEGVEIGLLKIRCYRPLPVEMIKDALKNAKNVAILDKSISLGMNKGAIYADVASHLKDKKTVNYIVGLGGRDITPEDILGIYDDVEISEDGKTNWIGLKEE